MELRHIHKEASYLLAVSGGIDSMVMADLFLQHSMNVQVVHCNFSLRGEESDMDQQLVQTWCNRHNIPFHVQRFNTADVAAQHSISIQEAARVLRYTYFNELLSLTSLDYVATAHHQDDTIETVFFHFLRGTGIKGMTGIPVSNEKIIRPLLHHSKKEIEAYAVLHSIEYRNDSSNKKEEYTRNKLRNTILPLIEESFPQLRQTMSKNINRFNEVNEIYQDAIEKMRRRLLEQRGQDYYIPIRKLQHVSPLQTITYELIKPFHFSFEQAIELIRLFDSHTGAYIQSHSHRIIRNREMLIITSIDTSASDMIIVNASSEEISCADFTVSFSRLAGPLDIRSKEKNVEWIDCQQLKYPLLLRKWRQGDYLYPLGMTKKKKVSRMLIDEKIALPEKEKIWVLESDKKIVWVSGIRIDHRYRMTNTTTDIVQIRLVKNTTA